MAPPLRKKRRVSPTSQLQSDASNQTRSDSDPEPDSSEDEQQQQSEAALLPSTTGQPSFLHASRGEAYLHAVARPSKTSANRLSDAFSEPFTRASYLAALSQQHPHDLVIDHSSSTLMDSYASRYSLWTAELLAGHSLLFHGLGSKVSLLSHLAKSHLSKRGHVVLMPAYVAGVALPDLLSELERVLGLSSSAVAAEPGADKHHLRVQAVGRHLDRVRQRAFLVVHSLDAPPCRSNRFKGVLAALASHPRIHLLASIDHLKAMLLFPSQLASSNTGFAFIHHHTPTFQPYTQETLLSGSISNLFPPTVFPSLASSASNSNAAKMASALAVLASLQSNAKDLFRHILTTQLSRTSQSNALAAVRYDDVLEACKRHFWANSESQMESLLVEFKDHEIVKSGLQHPSATGSGGGEAAEVEDAGANGWLWVDMAKSALEGVLERMD